MGLKIRMQEQRDKGLQQPIPKNNIGFKLLSKMGYKQKDNTSQHKANEIIIRANKSGLGMHEQKREKMEKLESLMVTTKKQTRQQFAESIRQKAKHRKCIKDIEQSMIISHNLNATDDEQKDDEEIDLQILSYTECTDKLSKILTDLRENHLFCYWCGVKYEDTSSMNAHCPGTDEKLHDSLNDL